MYHTNGTFKKSRVLIAAIFAAVSTTSFAQSYYHSPDDTVIGTAFFDDVSVFNITQIHPTSDTIYFKWEKVSVVMPSTWEASICDNGHCYTSLKDSGEMAPIVPGDNGLMSLHVNPHFEAGTATIRYAIFATNTPAQIDTLTWVVTAIGSNHIDEHLNVQPQIHVANGQLSCKNLNNSFSILMLYDAAGRILVREQIDNNEFQLTLQDYQKQLLFLKLAGKEIYTTRFFNY